MDFGAAQRDASCAYVGGAPGVLVSGLVWLTAGLIASRFGDKFAFTTLFAGGILIWPASLLLARTIFAAPKVNPANPLDRVGLESTFVLFGGILIAYGLLHHAPALAVPVVAVTIGARYFLFRTLYGEPVYWLLGGLIAAIGGAAMLGVAVPTAVLSVAVGVVEIGCSVLLLVRWRRRQA